MVFATFPSIPVISISDAQQRPVAGAGWIRTIHHGLPERLLTPQPVAPAYFAFLGRISPEKAVDQAIWIAKRCGVLLKIAAKVDAVDRDYFESEIRKLLTPPDVEYIGEVSDGEKSSFLSGAIALLAPIAWPEPFGLVLIEAMACVTPVIAFNRGSISEIVEDGLTGFIVERKEEAVAATDQLSWLSRGAIRRRFEERFTARRMAHEYLAVYRGASWINDVPDGTRTALENFWCRVLRAALLIKPRSKSPAEAGLKWPSMQKLRVNGIICAAGWPAIADDVRARTAHYLASRADQIG
jgi:hypothetical protein